MFRFANSPDQPENSHGRDHSPSTSSENGRKENRNGTSIPSKPHVRGSGGSSGQLPFYDASSNNATMNGHGPHTASANIKSIVTGTTLRPPALAFSHQQAVELSKRVFEQITADKAEVVNMIANYAVEPLEMLHLGKSTRLFIIG